jgi:DNA-binding GntR family transcriptional regulator
MMLSEDFEYRPLAERVFSELRQQIAQGTLKPRDRLVQEHIANELSVSRTPVREALNRLAQEGLVTWVPGVGYVVAKAQQRDVADVQGVRQVLEVAALAQALPHYNELDLARLKSVFQEMVDADPALADYVDLTHRFHRLLVQPCPNKLLLSLVEDTWSRPVSVKVTGRYGDSPHAVEVMITDHREIIEAIESGEPDRAVSLLDAHISAVHVDIAAATV